MAELTREVKRELRFDSYDDSGLYFWSEQPPYKNVSMSEWEGGTMKMKTRSEVMMNGERVEVLLADIFCGLYALVSK